MARKTKQEAQETRHSIMDAAEMLFLQHGVSRTSLQDIAHAAEVTRGAIYWHFKDKAELFDAMMQRATMPLEQGMNPREASSQPLSLSELRWGLVNVFYCTVHNEHTRRVFEIAMQKVEYTGEMQALRERKLAARRAWRELNKAAFEQAVSQGQMPATLNTQVASIALVSLVDGLLHQWIADPDSFDLLDIGRQAIENFLSSMAMGHSRQLLPPMPPAELARLGQQGACSGFGEPEDAPDAELKPAEGP